MRTNESAETDARNGTMWLLALCLALAVVIGAFAHAQTFYRGYAETDANGTVAWLTFFAGWAALTIGALVAVRWLRGSWLYAGTLASAVTVAWPVVVIAMYILMTIASCAGVGTHRCAFS